MSLTDRIRQAVRPSVTDVLNEPDPARRDRLIDRSNRRIRTVPDRDYCENCGHPVSEPHTCTRKDHT